MLPQRLLCLAYTPIALAAVRNSWRRELASTLCRGQGKGILADLNVGSSTKEAGQSWDGPSMPIRPNDKRQRLVVVNRIMRKSLIRLYGRVLLSRAFQQIRANWVGARGGPL